MPVDNRKKNFYKAQIPSAAASIGLWSVAGGFSGFGTSLVAYMFTTIGRLFKGIFMGDEVPGVDNVNILKMIGEGLTSLPGIGWLFKPFVNGFVPVADTVLTMAINGAIRVANLLPGNAIPLVSTLGFFGWVAVMFPLIVSISTIQNARDERQQFVSNLDDEWLQYISDYKDFKSGRRDEEPAAPNLGIPELGSNVKNRTFSPSRMIKMIGYCVKLPLYIAGFINEPKWPVHFDNLSPAEKVLAAADKRWFSPDSYWISLEFLGLASLWYPALLVNPEKDESLNTFLRAFSVIGSVIGGYLGFTDQVTKIQKEWVGEERRPTVGVEQAGEDVEPAADKLPAHDPVVVNSQRPRPNK